MPIAFDPQATFGAVLRRDQDRDPRPTFLLRHPTARVSRRLREIWDLPNEAMTSAVIDEVWAITAAHLAGWTGMRDAQGREVQFTGQEGPEAVLSEFEIWEVAALLVRAGRMGPDERKNLPSPSPSGGASSAPAAGGP